MKYSVCIPIFNQNALELGKALSLQSKSIEHDVEILFLDDGSDKSYVEQNQALNGLAHVRLELSSENLGRSSVRNKLAELAQGEYLLFLDGDSMIVKEDFLRKYFESETAVTVGGRIYSQSPTKGVELHWNYGIEKESKPASVRNQQAHSNFHSNNFLIKKETFNNIQFEEKLNTYGHEDTLFGLELEKQKIPIHHIENPVLHGVLESNESFLNKTELGLKNLLLIYSFEAGIKSKSPILAAYLNIKRLGLKDLIAFKFRLFKPMLIRNLYSNKPSLRYFNYYKIGYLCSIS